MPCLARLRRKIYTLCVVVLLASIVKLMYEFRTAQRANHSLNRKNNPPPLPHSRDPGSALSRRSDTFWTASKERPGSHVARADTKINNDNSHYVLHVPRDRYAAAASLPAVAKGVYSGAAPSWGAARPNGTSLPCLVVMVCSKPDNTELRLAIRKTWDFELDKTQVVVRFFVGHDEAWDDIIEREQALHNDVVITDYMDTYENLSYKVLAAMSWALQHVRSARYVMKTDDDTYLNLPYILHELRRSNNVISDATRSYIIGAVCVDSPVVREDGDKWFVSELDYPSDVYPTYVFGGAYVMTRAAAESILAASLKADYLHLEDVFITGILARAAGVVHVSHPGFAFWTSKRPSFCDVVTGRRLSAVNMTSKQFYNMYSGIHAILRTGNWTKCG